MSKRPALFTEADVKRAVRAVQAVGVGIAGVRVEPDGTIHVVVGEPQPQPVDAPKEWRL